MTFSTHKQKKLFLTTFFANYELVFFVS